MRSAVALFVILLAAWLLLSGHYTPMLIAIGVICCAFVVWLAWRMRIVDPEGIPVQLLPRAPRYLPWLAKEVVRANVDVAKRTLTPGRPNITPELFYVETSQRSDLGRVLYANSIMALSQTKSPLCSAKQSMSAGMKSGYPRSPIILARCISPQVSSTLIN